MKKNLLLLTLGLFVVSSVNAQTGDKETVTEGTETLRYNRWSVEAGVGQSKGVRPFSDGYFSSNPDKYFGTVKLNYFTGGVRYMFSPSFGIKLDGSYDKFENNKQTSSKPFEVDQLRFGLQGVVNAARLLDIQEKLGRFSFLVHAGLVYSIISPQLDTPYDPISGPSNVGRSEDNGGIMVGVTPQFRILNALALTADVSGIAYFRQHFAWDGHYSADDNNLSGQMIMASLGLSYSIGNGLHGDWAIIEEDRQEEIDNLDKRIGELETMMNDADKDGVPDYLDAEPNSVTGVAVDTKGRMVDANGNGVADELEKYVDSSIATTIERGGAGSGSDAIKRLINEGYIAVFFDFGSSRPTPSSTQNVAFILNYMRSNPSSSADITGYADEIGSTENNNALSARRAEFIKATLVKAGIDASRLNIIPAGEDASVDKDSDMARRLVRKVIFMIK